MANQGVVEVDPGLDVVIGGAGETGGDAVAGQGQQAPGPLQPQGPEAGQLEGGQAQGGQLQRR